ncbi:MAG: transposase [Planctomycetota bacterium]
MIRVPRDFRPLLDQLSSATQRPETARRLILFSATALLMIGDRTVSAVLRLLAMIEPLNPSTYHRVFSHRKWSARKFARIIAGFVIKRFCPTGVVRLVGDETVDGHRGKRVYGKARHRDAVRSTHSHTVYRYGHKWIVLAVLVRLPYTSRPIALPILVALYRDQKTNAAEGRSHKTPAELMCGLLAMLMHWFPEKRFVFAGDSAYGTHQMSRFASRHRKRFSLVSKFVADANLFKLPPHRRPGTNGRPRVKGDALPKPCEVVARKKRGKKLRVGWYGGGWRNVEVITGIGHWFKSGKGLVEVRWVFVRDLDGTHRDEYFFTTDVSLPATAVIEMYDGRWNVETTFQELRAHLGLETTRGWHRNTVLRMAPCLFVLYTIVVVFYDTMPQSSPHLKERIWLGKEFITFSDMIISVRHYLWMNWVFEQVPQGGDIRKLSRPIKRLLDFGLTQAT